MSDNLINDAGLEAGIIAVKEHLQKQQVWVMDALKEVFLEAYHNANKEPTMSDKLLKLDWRPDMEMTSYNELVRENERLKIKLSMRPRFTIDDDTH